MRVIPIGVARGPGNSGPVSVIGIDDFAWKRGQRYGTLVCDLEQRRVIDLLPDREPATIEAWLTAHPEIALISRDRGGGYGSAATKAAPQAVQVADRWHLMGNVSAAFLEAVSRSMRSIRAVLNATVINPALLTCAERIQYEGFLLRQDSNRTIKALAAEGMSIKNAAGGRRRRARTVADGHRRQPTCVIRQGDPSRAGCGQSSPDRALVEWPDATCNMARSRTPSIASATVSGWEQDVCLHRGRASDAAERDRADSDIVFGTVDTIGV